MSELKFDDNTIKVIVQEAMRAAHFFYNNKFDRLPKLGFNRQMITTALQAAVERSNKRKRSNKSSELARVLALASSTE